MIDELAEASVPAELLCAAVTESSIALAVCDHDFAVIFFNPAIARLLVSVAGDSSANRHGVALLQALGVSVDGALAGIAEQGTWQGVARQALDGDSASRRDLHVVVEPFGDSGTAAGWLITAREQPGRIVAPSLSERDLIARCARLTPREREVMLALHAGSTNKAIAQALKISPRTVEFHRARIMQRFAATSLVDLVRKVAADATAPTPP
ncbi:LuxR C-terminal-related transcriptional regulator [Sphingomonas sp. RT2P30]|uniref:LuxR C-terminal-related transcriptional regulator n=1 Tax=Parasphingomonas halimpatiens TaxID=3096162 RepID=UPI002FCB5BD3